MDTITNMAMSVDVPLLKAVGMLLQDSIIYAGIVLALLLVGESRKDKRMKVLLSLALAALLAFGIKHVLAYERPCVDGEWCPGGYSFPSMHATVAFTLMTAFLNKKSYPLYLFFALFVGFTRLNLGVHTFYDIAAALPIAMLSYYAIDMVWERGMK